jgi:hypothetical protein
MVVVGGHLTVAGPGAIVYLKVISLASLKYLKRLTHLLLSSLRINIDLLDELCKFRGGLHCGA